LDVPYPLDLPEGGSKSLLTQFSGEPQIVNALAISQLTQSLSRDPGATPAAVTQTTSPVLTSTTITLSGTYGTLIQFLESCFMLGACLSYTQSLSDPQKSFVLLLHFTGDLSETTTISKIQFMEIVQGLHYTASPIMNPPLFIFKLCPSAAGFNEKILADNNFDLNVLISKQHPSQLSHGSELRNASLLEELLGQHPFWPRLKSILSEGAHFPLEEISSEEKEEDLIFHASRGNHKSASKNVKILRDIIKEDVKRGFALPLPITALHFLKNASLAPLGCIQQSSIDMLGNYVVKSHMTHNQSFPGTSNKSVNLRVQHQKLSPIRYSFVLL